MDFSALHSIGTLAAIGGGGKTTLLTALYHALPGNNVLTTTTHMFAPGRERVLVDPSPQEAMAALRNGPAVILGPVCESAERLCADVVLNSGTSWLRQKYGAPSPRVMAVLLDRAAQRKRATTPAGVPFPEKAAAAAPPTAYSPPWGTLLIEADGSRGRPLKLHGAMEPAVPKQTDLVLFVAGLNAIGKPGWEVVHRTERMKAILNKSPEENIVPQDIVLAAAAARTNRYRRYIAVLNQASDLSAARWIQQELVRVHHIPSVLLEMRDVSSPREERLLAESFLSQLSE